MAHFAKIDKDNIVVKIAIIANEDCLDSNGVEQESIGIEFCRNFFRRDDRWLQTSYNGNIRKNYAGIGYRYDEERDAFIPPKVFPSWVLDEETCRWKAPVDRPESGDWVWDENSLSWVEPQSIIPD